MTDIRMPALGYASGAFDLLHVGHLRYLQAAAARCRRLLVGIPDDEIIMRVKGHPPLVSQAERRELVAGLACVGEALAVSVSMDDTSTFAAFLEAHGVNAAFIGADWQHTPRWQRLEPALLARGITVHFLPRAAGISSTRLRRGPNPVPPSA
ncbi:adenylyltransferase/cytidyltransferase family protein [Niveispirillum fermenti]|uniref:adenylyltransferase/cytidyltransferase family protein n=1 Tax=Niveispirillum fermenti TaxID=1233113 RepID=UPI003A86D058